MKKQKTLTTAKLIRMTPEQLVKSKTHDFSSIVRLLADTWGSRKSKTLVDVIITTLKK